MTLWAMGQSPLILGANLTMLDAPTLKLLTNREVLRIDQQAIVRGKPVEGFGTGDLRVWRAVIRGAPPVVAVGLFNLSDVPLKVSRSRASLGLLSATDAPVPGFFDVWAGKPLPETDWIQLTIPPHGCVLLERR